MMCVLHEVLCVLCGDEERSRSEDMSWGTFQGTITRRKACLRVEYYMPGHMVSKL